MKMRKFEFLSKWKKMKKLKLKEREIDYKQREKDN